MKKVIHLEKITLKCDACEWEKPVTLSREWIDTPCPKCGANLLTEGDYKAGERLINLANMVNRILGPLFGKEKMPEGEKLVRINPRERKTTIWHGEDK
jgi:predicted RNA-binding Zn-ribbon protein involved in translation (DUF1610 family)